MATAAVTGLGTEPRDEGRTRSHRAGDWTKGLSRGWSQQRSPAWGQDRAIQWGGPMRRKQQQRRGGICIVRVELLRQWPGHSEGRGLGQPGYCLSQLVIRVYITTRVAGYKKVNGQRQPSKIDQWDETSPTLAKSGIRLSCTNMQRSCLFR